MVLIDPYQGQNIAACADLPPDFGFPDHRHWIDNVEELAEQGRLSQRKVNLVLSYAKAIPSAKNRNDRIKKAMKLLVAEGEFTSDDVGVIESVFTTGISKEKAQDDRAREMIAKACSFCPTAQYDSCLSYALHNKVQGIWAGTTEKDRKEIRAEQGIKAKAVSSGISRTIPVKQVVHA